MVELSERRQGKVIVVVGGYRTGSTLQYNLLGEYLEHAGLGRRLGYVLPDDADEVVQSTRSAGGFGVAKCHHLAVGFRPLHDEAAWGDIVRRGHAIAVSTTRPRGEFERSMCRKFGIEPSLLEASLEWRENEANTACWSEVGPIEQTFESLTARPRRSLRWLLAQLEVPIKRRSIRAAHAATRLERVIEHQGEIPRGEWDPVTLVHWDHVEQSRSRHPSPPPASSRPRR